MSDKDKTMTIRINGSRRGVQERATVLTVQLLKQLAVWRWLAGKSGNGGRQELSPRLRGYDLLLGEMK